MTLINILQEALKKIEYTLRKASLTDCERIQDIRIVVCNAISEIESDGVIYAAVSKSETPDDERAALESHIDAALSNAPAAEVTTYHVEYDGFIGTKIGAYRTCEGRDGVVLQQVGTKVVHVYGANRIKIVGDEAKKSEGAPGRNCSDTSRSNCELERAPSDPTADRREIVAQIIDPSAFEPNNLAQELFYIDLWKRRALAKADAILATLDGGREAPATSEAEGVGIVGLSHSGAECEVRVKPLEWDQNGSAPSIFGSYRLTAWSGGSLTLTRPGQYQDEVPFTTVDEAKAAAQVNYEQRILSALSTSGGAVESNGNAEMIDGVAALAHALYDSENTTKPTERPELLKVYLAEAEVVSKWLGRFGWKIVRSATDGGAEARHIRSSLKDRMARIINPEAFDKNYRMNGRIREQQYAYKRANDVILTLLDKNT